MWCIAGVFLMVNGRDMYFQYFIKMARELFVLNSVKLSLTLAGMARAWSCMFAFAVSAYGCPGAGAALGPYAVPDPVVEAEILDEPPLEEHLQPDGVEAGALALSENNGISHIEVGGALTTDLAAGLEASLEARCRDHEDSMRRADELQASLASWDATAVIDRATPTAGHCLFHSLRLGAFAKTWI